MVSSISRDLTSNNDDFKTSEVAARPYRVVARPHTTLGLVGDRAPSTLSTQIGPHTTLAFTWFMSLLAGSVSGWTDLEKQFHKYFLSGLGPEGR